MEGDAEAEDGRHHLRLEEVGRREQHRFQVGLDFTNHLVFSALFQFSAATLVSSQLLFNKSFKFSSRFIFSKVF